MVRKILFIIAISICFIQNGETKNNDDVFSNLGLGLSDGIDPCSGMKCIHKCCPFGQYVKRKRCEDYVQVFDFSNISVYDKNIYDTGKTVKDVFAIVPGKFIEDPEFMGDSINMNQLGFIPYVTESGVLQLEMPNVYKHWTPVPSGNYCVDYLITKKGTLMVTPKFWAIIEDEDIAESNIYLTGATLVSCVFMLLVLVVYFLLPELQNLCGLILMAYVASLFMAFLLLATIQMAVHTEHACVGLTLGIYFFFLASFCWMSVMSYDIWWTFRGYAKARPIHRRGERFKFLMYCLYAWGLPLLMTIGLAVLNEVDMKHIPWFITPHVPEMGCFLEGGIKMLYLYVPMLILILCNWMFYLMTAFNVWRLNRGTAVLDSAAAGTPAAHRTQRHRFMVYLKLSIVMGLNWLFEIVSFVYPGFKMWYISDAYNILIGLAIFLIFVCKKKIYRKLYKRYLMNNSWRIYPGSSKSYSSSTSDSNGETTTLHVCANPKGLNGYSNSMNSMKTF